MTSPTDTSARRGVVALRGAPWELDPNAIFAPDQGIGKVFQAAARNAAMLVYVSEEISGSSPAETSPELMFISTMAGGSLTQLIEDPRTSAFSTPLLIIGLFCHPNYPLLHGTSLK